MAEVLPRAEDWSRVSAAELGAILGRPFPGDWNPAARLRQAEADHAELQRSRIRFFVFGDGGYPPLLEEIDDPPLLVFYRGQPSSTRGPFVAVVGTRHPTGRAERAAVEIGAELGRHGAVVVSGLAFGIDGAAHRGALLHGRTWAWLASSPDRVSPRAHTRLAHALLDQGGLLLSEYPPPTPALRGHFPLRNRLISGQSHAVVLVQAPLRSGAMITVRRALQQNRDVFVHRDGLHPTAGSGGMLLVEQGARVIASWDDLEKELPTWTR